MRVRAALVLVLAVVLAIPSTAMAATPPSAASLYRVSTAAGAVVVIWSLPPNADAARVCWVLGSTPPASPTAAGALCEPVTTRTDAYFSGRKEGEVVSVSVFAHSTTTGLDGPPVGETVTVEVAPRVIHDLWTTAVTSTSLGLGFYTIDDYDESDARSADIASLEVIVEPGVSTVPATGKPTHTFPYTFEHGPLVIGGLAPGRVYSFTVRGRDSHGRLSQPRMVVGTTRIPGLYFVDNTTSESAVPSKLRVIDVDAAVTAAGREHVLVSTSPAYHLNVITYRSRAAGGSWSAPLVLATNGAQPRISANARGDLLASWSTGSGGSYRIRAAGSTWGPVRTLATRNDELQSVVLDGRGRVHAALWRDGASPGLYYRTNASGAWTSRRVSGAGKWSSGRDTVELAYDAVANRIALLHLRLTSTQQDVQVSSTPAAATTMPALSVRASLPRSEPSVAHPRAARATAHIASAAGRITVVVGVGSIDGPHAATDGVFVMTGRSVSELSPLTRLAGTTSSDFRPVLTATSGTRLSVAWYRRSPTWSVAARGVWHESLTLTSSGKWASRSIEHVTTSAYDEPRLVAIDAGGRRHVAVHRSRESDGGNNGVHPR